MGIETSHDTSAIAVSMCQLKKEKEKKGTRNLTWKQEVCRDVAILESWIKT